MTENTNSKDRAADFSPIFKPRADGHYRLSELLAYDDEEFLRGAYLALLRRAPDESGSARYLDLLRGGASKIDVLGWLRDSEEGRANEVRVDGLAIAYIRGRIYRLPVVGRLVQIAVGIWDLPERGRIERMLESRMAHLAMQHRAQTREVERAVRALRDVTDGLRQMMEYGASKADLAQVDAAQIEARRALESGLEELRAALALASESRPGVQAEARSKKFG